MSAQPSHPDLPRPSEPATLPQRGRSGKPINLTLIRALAETLDAVKECDQKLDETLEAVRRARRRGSIPPDGLRV